MSEPPADLAGLPRLNWAKADIDAACGRYLGVVEQEYVLYNDADTGVAVKMVFDPDTGAIVASDLDEMRRRFSRTTTDEARQSQYRHGYKNAEKVPTTRW